MIGQAEIDEMISELSEAVSRADPRRASPIHWPVMIDDLPAGPPRGLSGLSTPEPPAPASS